ncbi:4-alpha-glucanotransferase [Pseudochryseolinea flava]|uniref:4-alpha-glucanotransferase n=1 Tax=Pseudochryseolinea flava TaxID=2059302 RepID=A0A364Y227_9BACT|nr:4-alpha-glucanotransferase [Pseudochryseolinea flava]RAW00925.1 4-alpha-glucanotransferase [Pseudochryseolinea flava]
MHSVSKQQPFIKQRGAGILLHITSLPSAFGIGDVGPAARSFADFLVDSKQKYWQVLPLNPTSSVSGHSPYSSASSMASNALLISPEDLMSQGLLTKSDLKKIEIAATDRVNFNAVTKNKASLLKEAFKVFESSGEEKKRFEEFCKAENQWLHDYAVFMLLKSAHDQKAWNEWPAGFRNRDEKKIASFIDEHQFEYRFTQWQQFVFQQQWKSLREYCNTRNIKLFGDLPFYVSHDSVDVWKSPEIFSLDKKGSMYTSAGVPPDYFNDDGQHWGMPVYRWDVMRKNHYAWWMQRLHRNLAYFDLLRLDHFRAFADYWEVPAKEKTAKKGKWKPGPGASFFQAAKEEFDTLPFVAEDLGDINQPVYDLRDEFQLPGMLVLQFAFGDNMATSDYIPHRHVPNSIVYTGTHDNNTTVGWLRKDADRKTLKRLIDYAQRDVHEDNVHDVLTQMAYSSVSNTVIIPWQDIVGLNEKSRMNTPASVKNNWSWRMTEKMYTKSIANKLARWVDVYGR